MMPQLTDSVSGLKFEAITSLAQLPEKIIDFHVHLFPDHILRAIWRRFITDYGWETLHQLYWLQTIAYLRERGVGPIIYSNYAHRRGVAESLNRWNLKILDETPDLYCFAAYHPDDENALQAAESILKHPRILGIKLQLLVQRFYPHDARLFPMYEMVMGRGKKLLLHVGNGPVGNEFVGLGQFEKLLQRYPDIPAIIAHMGALEYEGFADLIEAYPNLYMDTAFAFLPGLGNVCTLSPERLGRIADRLLYGSDFPNILFPREVEIDYLLNLGLPQSFYDGIFRDNGRRILKEISAGRQDRP